MSKRKQALKPPGPAFGGKSRAAALIWERFGNPDNYIEPFFNMGSVLFKNPNGGAKLETVNDLDCYIANFWRAVKEAPDLVSEHADWPVNEIDLHARHKWLIASPQAVSMRDQMRDSPDFYDPKIAGWWIWGLCLWIGSGWCDYQTAKMPRLHHDQGVNKSPPQKMPMIDRGEGRGVLGCGVVGGSRKPSSEWNQMPRDKGRGVGSRPQLGDAYSRGRGVHSNDHANTCEERSLFIRQWIRDLSDRLRNVRVLCGDWSRVCKSETVTTRLGVTAVFFDPPYRTHIDGKKSRSKVYATDRETDHDQLMTDVRDYCLERGQEKDMRIALCSYEGEGNEILEENGWSVVSWKSNGYGNNTVDGKKNAARERIWFSPHCIVPERDLYPLFPEVTSDVI